MSKGYVIVAQNNLDYNYRIAPNHNLVPQYEGIHVDVWYKELPYIKGQHIYNNGSVYKVNKTSKTSTNFEELDLKLIVKNVRLIDDENTQLDFYRAHTNDLVLSNNKLYTVKQQDNKISHELTSIYKGIHVDVYYDNLEYITNQHVLKNNIVYKMTCDSTIVDDSTAEIIVTDIKLYEDANKSLWFEDAKAGDKVLYYNHLFQLEPVVFDDYIKQACYLAASLHKFNANAKISVITNDIIPEEYTKLFDHIIPIPYGDAAANSIWKVENRWKVYHSTPYDETVVFDTDMFILQDISSWWDYFDNYELYFTTQVKTYRDKLVTSDAYRKTFVANNLPNIYTGMYYFKKCKIADDFFDMLELICKDWEIFYEKFLPKDTPFNLSIDVASALAIMILGIEDKVTNKQNTEITFIHMKPKIQEWRRYHDSWQASLGVYFDQNTELKLGNHRQSGILHYTESNFLDNIEIESILNV
jgi:hypothetical protein